MGEEGFHTEAEPDAPPRESKEEAKKTKLREQLKLLTNNAASLGRMFGRYKVGEGTVRIRARERQHFAIIRGKQHRRFSWWTWRIVRGGLPSRPDIHACT